MSFVDSATCGKGLIIGRFQPFHNGHLYAVKTIAETHEGIIIGIGSAQYSRTPDNPFSGDERRIMIETVLETNGIKNAEIVLINDLHDHKRWVSHVVKLCPDFSIVYSNDPLTVHLFTQAHIPVKPIDYLNRNEFMGKEVRRRIRNGLDWEHLVPKEVARIIRDIGGEDIIRRVGETVEETVE